MLVDVNKASDANWEKYVNEVLAHNLKEYREEAGMTQYEVSVALQVSKATISRYESGSRTPNSRQLNKLADLFGCTVRCLRGWETKESKHIADIVRSGDYKTLEDIMGLDRGSIRKPDEQDSQIISAEQAAENARLMRLEIFFHRLNKDGQEVAVDRVEELSKIPDYQKPDEN